jgi:hypothetical protein
MILLASFFCVDVYKVMIRGSLLCGCMKSMIFSIAVWAEVTTACVGDKITKLICSAFGILTGCSVSYLYILGLRK